MRFFSSSLLLKKTTHNQINLLLNKDFSAFEKSRNTKNSLKNFYTIGQFFAMLFAKKTFLYLGIFCGIFFVTQSEQVLAMEVGSEKTFIATAYYSPQPGQNSYMLGSYEADKKLNGGGTHGADGTTVYAGMIAAPRNYAFGTKIDLDGLGVVSVHDRGGSIGAGNGFDRIDIWMGSGDEGLARTKAWGRREITGTIVSRDTPVNFSLEKVNTGGVPVQNVVITRLKALGYDTTKNFKEVVTDFQMDYGIVPSRTDEAAGIYGPKTTAKLLEVYNNFLKTGNISKKTETQPVLPTKPIEETVTYSGEKMSINEAEDLVANIRTGFFGKHDAKVKNLQNFLIKMNYDTAGETGIMNLETLHALRRYQHSRKVSETGRVDLVTQIQMVNDLTK